MNFCGILLSLALFTVTLADPLIFQPPNAGDKNTPARIILLAPGAFMDSAQYLPLIQLMQRDFMLHQNRLFVGMPEARLWQGGALTDAQFEGDMLALVSAMQDVLKPLVNIGVRRPRWVYAGHSRGSIFMQDFVHRVLMAQDQNRQSGMIQQGAGVSLTDVIGIKSPLLGVPVDGLMLFSSAIRRMYRADTEGGLYLPESLQKTFPILTFGGELDGLFRIFRQAEAFYHHSIENLSVGKYKIPLRPVLVIRGGSHMSFGSGKTPPFVNLNDMRPEITSEAGTIEISKNVVAFLLAHFNEYKLSSLTLKDAAEQSSLFFEPIVESLLLEGSLHFKPPCNELKSGDIRLNNCWRGSPWSQYSQSILAGLDDLNVVTRRKPEVSLEVTDDFWKVWLINPVHLPEIEPSTMCSSNSGPKCKMSVSTVTQCTYGFSDNFDLGITPSSCDEMRVKMKSRQSIYTAAQVANASFAELDDNNLVCQNLNQKALDWALIKLKEASNLALAVPGVKTVYDRYMDSGRKMVIGEDLGPFNIGPLWIWHGLESAYKTVKDTVTGEEKKILFVESPSMRTPEDFPIPLSAGFHYCKLMSPAHVLEWMYTDGIKEAYKLP